MSKKRFVLLIVAMLTVALTAMELALTGHDDEALILGILIGLAWL